MARQWRRHFTSYPYDGQFAKITHKLEIVIVDHAKEIRVKNKAVVKKKKNPIIVHSREIIEIRDSVAVACLFVRINNFFS